VTISFLSISSRLALLAIIGVILMEGSQLQLYKAQYIYPVSSPPISDGIITIDGERKPPSGQQPQSPNNTLAHT